MKKIILILAIIIVGVIGYGVYINFDIQNNVNQIIKEDSRNQGIEGVAPAFPTKPPLRKNISHFFLWQVKLSIFYFFKTM